MRKSRQKDAFPIFFTLLQCCIARHGRKDVYTEWQCLNFHYILNIDILRFFRNPWFRKIVQFDMTLLLDSRETNPYSYFPIPLAVSAIIPFTYIPQFCISLKKFTPYRISIKAEEIVWLWWKIEHGAASHIQAPNFSNSPLFSHKKSELSATMLPIQVSWHSKRQILSSWTFPTCQRHFIICEKKQYWLKVIPSLFERDTLKKSKLTCAEWQGEYFLVSFAWYF